VQAGVSFGILSQSSS